MQLMHTLLLLPPLCLFLCKESLVHRAVFWGAIFRVVTRFWWPFFPLVSCAP